MSRSFALLPLLQSAERQSADSESDCPSDSAASSSRRKAKKTPRRKSMAELEHLMEGSHALAAAELARRPRLRKLAVPGPLFHYGKN
ncbi:MAG: hypothetical protein RIK87_10790 [Fuerstiella sp.]